MPKVELGDIRVDSLEAIGEIYHKTEREFARFLIHKNGHKLEVDYEPTRFESLNSIGSTVPDFRLRNLESGKESYIELTAGHYNEQSDPKKKQKEVVELVAQEMGENILYIVLYAQQLQRIQSTYPDLGLDFFRSMNGHVASK